MSFSITYKPLFTVELWHHFLLDNGARNFESFSTKAKSERLKRYDIGRLLDIVPTAETAKLLSGHRLVFRKNGTGFKVLALMDNAGNNKPLIVPEEDISLNFQLIVKDNSFFNITNIPFHPSRALFFSNFNRPENHFPLLSDIPSGFDATLAATMGGDGNPETFAYYQGDMVVDDPENPGQLYLANTATNAAPGHPDWELALPANKYVHNTHYGAGDVVWYVDGGSAGLYEAKVDSHHVNPSNIANWQKLSALPILYSSQNDLRKVIYNRLEYTFLVFDQELSITARDILGDQVFSTLFQPVESDPTLVIDGSKLAEGWLSVEVKDESDAIILSEELIFLKGKLSGNIAGLVQINVNARQQEYKLLNNDDTLRSPVFWIRLKNRKTNWRYFDAEGTELLETQPNPLVATGYIKVQIAGKDVPNPVHNQILPTIQKNYSDVYLNS